MIHDSQAIFEQLFESSPDGIVVTNQQGLIVRVNAQAEAMFSYPRSELVGRPVETLMPRRFQAAHPEHRQEYNAQPRTRPMGPGLELYGRRKDGSEFPADIMLSPVETRQGLLVLAVVRDVTARKRAEEGLRESEERVRSIVESVKDYAIFTLDPEGRVSSWSPAAQRIKGYSADEIIGQHFSRFYVPEDAERGKPADELKAAAEAGWFADEGWRLRKDGSRFWANVVITALRDKSGQLRGFSKVTRDFTERKQGEEALLLQVTNTLISSLDVRRLFAAISASVHQVTAEDYMNLALYDQAIGKLRLHTLDVPPEEGPLKEGTPIPLEGWPASEAFTTREPLVAKDPKDLARFSPEFINLWTRMGLRSGCWLPLLNRGRALGTLVIGSRRESAFADRDVRVLSHVAGQVALALDNAEAYRQVAELKDRLAEEKAYLEDELRTEYNFEEIVGESPALKRTLKQVETVAPTDATVLILGETGTGRS